MMQLEPAQKIAQSLIADLKPFCHRVEIGGSVRREKAEVKDIEIVCIPKSAEIGTGQATLFGGETTITENLLFSYLAGKSEYPIVKMGDKYCQFEYVGDWRKDDIKVDVFTATPETWGYIFLLRTGPAEFSKWVVTTLNTRRYTLKRGAVWVTDSLGLLQCNTPSERDVFRMLGIDWIEPEYRFKDVMWK